MDEIYGDVVKVMEPRSVEIKGNSRGVKATVGMPFDNWFELNNITNPPKISIPTDFDTARRMVEGTVSVLIVVSDSEDSKA